MQVQFLRSQVGALSRNFLLMTLRGIKSRLLQPWIVMVTLLVAVVHVDAWLQSSIRGLEVHLSGLFPEASRFSGRTGVPAHIKVFTGDPDNEHLIAVMA